jgi:hypothetical protein
VIIIYPCTHRVLDISGKRTVSRPGRARVWARPSPGLGPTGPELRILNILGLGHEPGPKKTCARSSLLMAYSMEFLPKKTQMSLNRLKGILSCKACKVVFAEKESGINIVPLGRYRTHNFSWKSWKFVKNKKICKICGVDFFLLYGRKSIPNIYCCLSWARAFAHMFFLILHLYKKMFLVHTGDLWQKW